MVNYDDLEPHGGSRPYSSAEQLCMNAREWQEVASPQLIGGRAVGDWVNTTFVGGNNTYILCGQACRWNGKITHMDLRPHTATAGIKFRLFRYNVGGGTYDMVVGSERIFATTVIDNTETVTFSSPIPCKEGDIPGFFWNGATVWEDVTAMNINKRYEAGDLTSNAFANTNAGVYTLALYGRRPYVAVAGDSIAEGRNSGAANNWCGFRQDVPPAGVLSFPGGDHDSEIFYRLGKHLFDDAELNWFNAAYTGGTFITGLATQVAEALAVGPHALIVAYGVNDIIAGETWANTLIRLNGILALYRASSAKQMILCEILPNSGLADVNDLKLRQFNWYFSEWCRTVSGAVLAQLHDAFGVIQVSTGALDTLNPVYDSGDGIHLSKAGVDAYATLIQQYIW